MKRGRGPTKRVRPPRPHIQLALRGEAPASALTLPASWGLPIPARSGKETVQLRKVLPSLCCPFGPASSPRQPTLGACAGPVHLAALAQPCPPPGAWPPCLGSGARARRGLTARRCRVVGTALGGGKSCRGWRALPSKRSRTPGRVGGSWGGAPWNLGVCAYCPPDRTLCWSYSDFPVSPTECRRLEAPTKIKFTPRATLGTFQPVRLNFPSSTGELEFP